MEATRDPLDGVVFRLNAHATSSLKRKLADIVQVSIFSSFVLIWHIKNYGDSQIIPIAILLVIYVPKFRHNLAKDLFLNLL